MACTQLKTAKTLRERRLICRPTAPETLEVCFISWVECSGCVVDRDLDNLGAVIACFSSRGSQVNLDAIFERLSWLIVD